MSKYFYSDSKRVQLFCNAAARMEFTPFYKGSCVPGRLGGVDCVHLHRWCLQESGFMLPEIPDEYPLDATQHVSESLIENWIEENGMESRFEVLDSLDPDDLMVGDVLHFNIAKGINHVGQMLPKKRFIHVLNPWGCRINRLAVGLRLGELVKVRRPLAV